MKITILSPASVRRVCLLLLLLATPGWAGEDRGSIRFGVLSIAPPARIHANWQAFVQYLSTELGRPVELVVPRGFGRMKQAVERGDVDFFYVNSYVFYRLKQAGAAVGVAQMRNIDGTTTSRSTIFVRSDSGIDRVEQLQGKRVAFVAPMGAGGYLAPRALLRGRGVTPGPDGGEVFTKNLSSSIHEVLLGEVDAGTMCGVNYELMSRKLDTGELKRIAVSDEYPENLIAARSSLDPATVARFAAVVTGMSGAEAGRAVLAGMRGMKIADFEPYDPAVEAITEKLLRQGGFEQ